jgi:hypothetical protein
LQKPEDLLYAEETLVRRNGGSQRTLRCRPRDHTWRAVNGVETVGDGAILVYLTNPPGSQIRFPYEDGGQ